MKILPNYSFDEAPAPDVLVLPGGDAGSANADPEIKQWIRRTVASADHVLTICTGIFFLEDNEILQGKRMTTWYDRQKDLQQAVPDADVTGQEVTVEDGKLVSAAGLGIEGSLRVLSKLHGSAWAEVVRLNMEYEPLPDSLRVPRIELADLKLPDQIYAAFPWRRAKLAEYQGTKREWVMAWQFTQTAPLDTLRTNIIAALNQEPHWTLNSQQLDNAAWTSTWHIQSDEQDHWESTIGLEQQDDYIELTMQVVNKSGKK